MEYERGEAKPLRGKTFPVKLSKEINYEDVEEVYERSMNKWEDCDRTFSRDHGYILVYAEGKVNQTCLTYFLHGR